MRENCLTAADLQLADQLLIQALDIAEDPAAAVSALMTAAFNILHRTFGEHHALDLMTSVLDETGAEFRRQQAH